MKVFENSVKKLEKGYDQRVVEMVSLFETFGNNLVNKDENIISLTKKIQECTQFINMELADFQRLEESFFSIIKEIKNSAQLVNSDGGLDEQKITVPIASHILFTLLNPLPQSSPPPVLCEQLNTALEHEEKNTLPNPFPKARPNEFPYLIPRVSLFDKQQSKNFVRSTSNGSPLQANHPLGLSSMENQSSNNDLVVPSTENFKSSGINSNTTKRNPPLPYPDPVAQLAGILTGSTLSSSPLRVQAARDVQPPRNNTKWRTQF